MRPWWLRRRSHATPPPSEDAQAALEQAQRALLDAQALGRYADDLSARAEQVHEQWLDTRARNHVAEAVAEAMRRKIQHS